MSFHETPAISPLCAARPTHAPPRRSLRIWLCALLLPLLVACGATAIHTHYYRVKHGDTLTQIARRANRSVDELRRWNKLSNVNIISVGQMLRVSPPGNANKPPARSPSPPSTKKPASSAKTPPSSSGGKPAPAPAPKLSLVRPAAGKIVQTYNGSTARGITIANAAGTPVVAAAAGTVAYVGSGLRAYGKLIIIQHNSQHLTIYAHNRTLLVKEGQKVSQGQKIAEMGNTGSNRVALYFELRRNGQAINPGPLH